jgi:hypothetical protein
VLLVPCFLAVVVNLPRRIPWDAAQYRAMPRHNADFDAEVALLKSQPGSAMCENLLLCFDGGKPYNYDPFVFEQMIKTGRIQESAILEMLDRHEFGAIQMYYPATEPLRPAARMRFSERFMRELFATYQPAMRNAWSVIFVPKP